MKITPLQLPGTFEITLRRFDDPRGYFAETYREAVFADAGLVTGWVQENQSLSRQQGTLRGLHFQTPPHAQTKLVRVLSGRALDVWVDLRKDSPTFQQWDALELSAESLNMVYIPQGFAHGFLTLTADVIVSYKVDAYYAPDHDAGLRWNDPAIAIDWPVDSPQLSEKDAALPTLADFPSRF
jgi:dTDP-4-dehydrorhamnose 3,5-epimerase